MSIDTSFKSPSDSEETPLISRGGSKGAKAKKSLAVKRKAIETVVEAPKTKKLTTIVSEEDTISISSDDSLDMENNSLLFKNYKSIGISDLYELKKVYRIFEKLPKIISDLIYKGGSIWSAYLDELEACFEKIALILSEAKRREKNLKKSQDYGDLKLIKSFIRRFEQKFGVSNNVAGAGVLIIAYISNTVSQQVLGIDLSEELRVQLGRRLNNNNLSCLCLIVTPTNLLLWSLKSLHKMFFNKSARSWVNHMGRNTNRSFRTTNFSKFNKKLHK